MTPDGYAGSAPGRSRWLPVVGLAVLLGGLFFLQLGEDVPMRTHEGLLAVTARNMVLNGLAQGLSLPRAPANCAVH